MFIKTAYQKINYNIIKLIILASIFLTPAYSFAKPQNDDAIQFAQMLSQAFEQVADLITPSVVNIKLIKKVKVTAPNAGPFTDPFFERFRDFFGDDFFDKFFSQPYPPQEGFVQRGLGTGVIIDEKGYIVTNHHVVNDSDEIVVTLSDGTTAKAKIVGTDPKTDLAVIKIDKKGLKAAKFGDSDQLKIGEWVIAVGNPFGLSNSITAGIVSAKGRSILGSDQYEDFIQTDAAINPGNSGGPLVNLKGEVVGINSAIFSKSGGYMGIGFAIPSNMVKTVAESLIKTGKVIRGWLGVGIQNLTQELADSFNYPSTRGALVGHIEPNGPADKAGLKQGDIIVRFNGKKIKNINQLRNIVAATKPGTKVIVEVFRNGKYKKLRVKIGELPAEILARSSAPQRQRASVLGKLGIIVKDLTPELREQLGARTKHGVVIEKVRPNSIAYLSGLRQGDVIISVNGKKIRNVGELKAALSKDALAKGVRLVVETQGMERFVFLRVN
ncbi:MAG: DegQ family serine endoprotease [Candidatus Dadabacteria bacterium]|nr:MAG: DegQ family serine endoprotease [Candidatus Dadabacteria bacterium]